MKKPSPKNRLFQGRPTRVLENAQLALEVLSDSARIVRLFYRGGENLFAEIPQQVQTEHGTFHFLGGHRLWHAPEAMPRTYLPDLGGSTLEELPDGLRITCPPEIGSGIEKKMAIQLDPERAVVTLRHELRNTGHWAIECAPWALTMFRQGGQVILPQPVGKIDEAGLLPNRTLVFWPYTQLDDPRLDLRDEFVLLQADPRLPPCKLGYLNPHGWMGYYREGILFVKRFPVDMASTYPDLGCSCECYCNDRFVELESLGPLSRLEPGRSFVHVETWELYDSLAQPFLPPSLRERLEASGKSRRN